MYGDDEVCAGSGGAECACPEESLVDGTEVVVLFRHKGLSRDELDYRRVCEHLA